MTSTRWIGDLSTCFLLEDGWAFRLKVNRFQVDKDRPGWQMPLSIAEALGLEVGQTLELECEHEDIHHTLAVERRDDACVGGRIGIPLQQLGCLEGDLAFIVFRADSYKVVARSQREVDPDDPLGLLLWHCGLDPNDDALRADPWSRLARTLGGTGATKQEVADRLRRRVDKRLLPLLEQAATHRRTEAADEWTPFWQYVLPDHDDEERLVLQRSDGAVRVALGILDSTAQPPMGLTLGDGNDLWATLLPSDEFDVVEPLLLTPPSGLVPSARRSSWVKWMRADHAGRRAALLGRSWNIHRTDGGWRSELGEFGDLQEALLSVRPDDSGASPSPANRIRHAYPRTGMAFSRLVDSAVSRGLNSVVGERSHGYVAHFDGATTDGASLVDVLAPGR